MTAREASGGRAAETDGAGSAEACDFKKITYTSRGREKRIKPNEKRIENEITQRATTRNGSVNWYDTISYPHLPTRFQPLRRFAWWICDVILFSVLLIVMMMEDVDG
jgi:hypothetical protein